MISLRTFLQLMRHFVVARRWFFLPLVVVLVAAGALLLATGGLAAVAPFVYAIF